MNILDKKQALRASVAESLRRNPQCLQNSEPARKLLASALYASAHTVLAFASMPDEIPTDLILKHILDSGRRLVLPRAASRSAAMTLHYVAALEHDLERSPLGFRQPRLALPRAAVEAIDLVIVPGVAFDARGRRLGRGAGHYDRLLSAPALKAVLAAIAADEQIVPEIPCEAHDRPVQIVFTPTRTLPGSGPP